MKCIFASTIHIPMLLSKISVFELQTSNVPMIINWTRMQIFFTSPYFRHGIILELENEKEYSEEHLEG